MSTFRPHMFNKLNIKRTSLTPLKNELTDTSTHTTPDNIPTAELNSYHVILDKTNE
ncbi:MAG: hypothetical protein ACQPRH_03640 [Solitalea-like symbiont of Tyrophagus putrescentiae]